MQNFKVKKTTFGDVSERFMTGFKKLNYEINSYKLTQKGGKYGLLDMIYRVDKIYRKDKDVTYVAVTPIGYIELFGASDNDVCLVGRFEGKVRLEAEDWKKEPYNTLTEEAYKMFKAYLDDKKD